MEELLLDSFRVHVNIVSLLTYLLTYFSTANGKVIEVDSS